MYNTVTAGGNGRQKPELLLSPVTTVKKEKIRSAGEDAGRMAFSLLVRM